MSRNTAIRERCEGSGRRVRALLGDVDLLISAGAAVFTMSLPGPVEPVPPGLAVVQMGQRDWEMGKNFPAEIAIRCALKPSLKLLAEAIESMRTPEQTEAAAKRAQAIEGKNWSATREKLKARALSESNSYPIKADFLMLKIAEEMPDDGVIVDEAVTSSTNLLKLLPLRDNCRFFGLPSGGLGWGVPGSIGVHLALPKRPLLAVVGDGSANYSIQGLYTAALNKLPITFVICNNRSYRILKQRLFLYDGPAAEKERFIGMDFQNPPLDWVKLAEGYGLKARRVTKAEEVAPALREGLQGGVANLIDVHLDDVFKP